MRMLMVRKGVAMGARSGGKLKAVMYMFAGAGALLAESARRLGFDDSVFQMLRWGSVVIFAVSVMLALTSFYDYYKVFRGSSK